MWLGECNNIVDRSHAVVQLAGAVIQTHNMDQEHLGGGAGGAVLMGQHVNIVRMAAPQARTQALLQLVAQGGL
jgi:hypothetical protein